MRCSTSRYLCDSYSGYLFLLNRGRKKFLQQLLLTPAPSHLVVAFPWQAAAKAGRLLSLSWMRTWGSSLYLLPQSESKWGQVISRDRPAASSFSFSPSFPYLAHVREDVKSLPTRRVEMILSPPRGRQHSDGLCTLRQKRMNCSPGGLGMSQTTLYASTLECEP